MIGKIFKAYDVRATYPDPLDEDAAWKVGYATGKFFKGRSDAKGDTVLVSRDMRPHSPQLSEALSNGIRATGLNVIDLGMCDTSFMYYAVNAIPEAIGGVQTTASHNPINYNGFKISGEHAKPIGADTGLKEIHEIAAAVESTDQKPIGTYEERDLWDGYRKHVLQFLTPLKRSTKVYIDASNGMAGVMVPKVFEEGGGIENLEIVKLNFEMGQGFAHEPNPLVAENMEPTQQGVRETGAALGACFDGDADRCIITDEKGEIIGCDHLTAMLAHHFVALSRTDPSQHHPTTIVYDLRSSKVVEETVRALGAVPRKSKVGHVNMKAVLRETGGIFGGELSGHFYFRNNYYADSGAIALAAVLSVLTNHEGKTLSQLIDPFRKYPQSGEINFTNDDKEGTISKLKKDYADDAEIDELDGVTINAFDSQGWWANIRASNTEPLLRLNAEAKDQATLDRVLAELKPELGEVAEGH